MALVHTLTAYIYISNREVASVSPAGPDKSRLRQGPVDGTLVPLCPIYVKVRAHYSFASRLVEVQCP